MRTLLLAARAPLPRYCVWLVTVGEPRLGALSKSYVPTTD